MPFVRTLPELEEWLDDAASSWEPLTSSEYADLIGRWSTTFGRQAAAGNPARRGHRAVMATESRLPGDLILFSGERVPSLANLGGIGPAAYRASGLRTLNRSLANALELVVVPVDFSWCCVFTHEAGDLAWEGLFESRFDQD